MTDNELAVKLVALRPVLEAFWAQWAEERGMPAAATGASMCRFTSAFLSDVLGWEWKVEGGYAQHPGEAAGFFDGVAWHGHYWVTDGRRVVDLTANQFGAEAILVTTVEDARYRANYSPAEVADALYYVEDRVEEWLGEYYKANSPALA